MIISASVLQNGFETKDGLVGIIGSEAIPIIRSVIARDYTLRSSTGSFFHDREDVQSEIILRLLERLSLLKQGVGTPLRSFHGYVKTVSRRVCYHQWQETRREAAAFNHLHAASDPHVTVISRGGEDGDVNTIEGHNDVDSCTTICRQEMLIALWQVIQSLPRRQRLALLLSARDNNGNSILPLLLVSKIADENELVTALEVTGEHLPTLMNQLPMADDKIADRIGITARATINARLTARRRLQRFQDSFSR